MSNNLELICDLRHDLFLRGEIAWVQIFQPAISDKLDQYNIGNKDQIMLLAYNRYCDAVKKLEIYFTEAMVHDSEVKYDLAKLDELFEKEDEDFDD